MAELLRERAERARKVLTLVTEPFASSIHASDCGIWIDEPCNCIVGKMEAA